MKPSRKQKSRVVFTPWDVATLLLVSMLLGACGGGELPGPEAIYPEDICDNCRMAITDVRYAAEIVTSRRVFKFDDFGCMVRGERRVGEAPYATYVMDYGTKTWLPAAEAVYVASSEIPTPMGFGVVAVGSRAEAESLATTLSGRVLDFDEAKAWVVTP